MFSIVQDMLLLVGAIYFCLFLANASPATHTIDVGNKSHKFEPDTMTASAGDVGSRARPSSQS
jgi:plastocyanin